MHHQASPFLPKSRSKPTASIRIKLIPEVWLSTEFIDTLYDLITGGITETREEGDELLSDTCVGGRAEDDAVHFGRHEP